MKLLAERRPADAMTPSRGLFELSRETSPEASAANQGLQAACEPEGVRIAASGSRPWRWRKSGMATAHEEDLGPLRGGAWDEFIGKGLAAKVFRASACFTKSRCQAI